MQAIYRFLTSDPRGMRVSIAIMLLLLLVGGVPETWAQQLPNVGGTLTNNNDLVGGSAGLGNWAMRIAALAVGAVAFIVVSMQVLAAYRIARERENWGGFLAPCVIGVVILIAIIWVLTLVWQIDLSTATTT